LGKLTCLGNNTPVWALCYDMWYELFYYLLLMDSRKQTEYVQIWLTTLET
jgi:hypothetical protein